MTSSSLKVKAARHAGLLIGCVLGLLSGLHIFGAAVGALLGYFIDELILTRKIVNKGAYIMENPAAGIIDDSWTRIVLSVALACAAAVHSGKDKVLGLAGKKLLEDKISNTLGLGGRETGLIRQLTDKFFLLSTTNTAMTASVYGTLSSDEERLRLLRLLIDAAAGESGRITSEQNDLLKGISVTFEITAADFNSLRIDLLSVDAEAYGIIGVTPDAIDSEIHKVYRQLASQFHPDTGGDLDEDQRAQSNEAFLKIQDAYERIVADRNALRTEGSSDGDTV